MKKCNYCGAPITSSLGICEYCNGSTSISNKIKSLFIKKDVKAWLIKTKNQINNKAVEPVIVFLKKQRVIQQGNRFLKDQKIISNTQLLGKYIKKRFSSKRNLALLVAIPLGFHLYIRVNYPLTAKPFVPDSPYKPAKLVGSDDENELIFYSNKNTKESRDYTKAWCKNSRKKMPLSTCLKDNLNESKYFDIGSKVKEGDWILVKLAIAYGDGKPSSERMNDAAINCRKKTIAFFYKGYPESYAKTKIDFPDAFDEEDEMQYRREKPAAIVKRMGKLWWTTNYSWHNDFELGEYLGWQKNQVRDAEKRLSEKINDKTYCPYFRESDKHRCTPKARKESIASDRDWLKGRKNNLNRDRLARKAAGVEYNRLLKAVCKTEPFRLF